LRGFRAARLITPGAPPTGALEDANRHAARYNELPAGPSRIRILDSTLREGEQHPGVSFSVKQRIQIAWELDHFGVDQIEISPVISEDHEAATRTIIRQGLAADIVAHGRALREDIDRIVSCGASWCAVYLGVSDVHMRDKLRIGRDEAVSRAVGAVEHAKAHGLKIRFTAEDGSRANPKFLARVCAAVRDAGADRISLPDTAGVMLPHGMRRYVAFVREAIGGLPLDVHVHNDVGLALANALAACEAGADQIHTTINGIGERTGIPALAEVATAIHYLYGLPNSFHLDMLGDLSRLIDAYTPVKTHESAPLVGSSAFKHKAGTHLAAVLANPAAYEPIPPSAVGNRRTIVFGELAGRAGAAHLAGVLGLRADDAQARRLAAGLKALRMGDILEVPLGDRLEGAVRRASAAGGAAGPRGKGGSA